MNDATPFPSTPEDEAEALFAWLRWGNDAVCPHCGERAAYRLNMSGLRRKRYKCRRCRQQFSVTKGTILEGSKLPPAIWMRIARMLCARSEPINAGDLKRELGIAHDSAQNALDRLRYAMKRPPFWRILDATGLPPAKRADAPRPFFPGYDVETILSALLNTPPPNA